MTDKPVPFSAEMVRAIDAGRKTMTRRILKIRSIDGPMVPIYPPEEFIELEPGEFARGQAHYKSTYGLSGPYALGYSVGDRLWAKEALQPFHGTAPEPTVQYVSTISAVPHRGLVPGYVTGAAYWRWKTSHIAPRYMPRWASRFTLLVEGVKVEPLNDITAQDAIAEGIGAIARPDANPLSAFAGLWESLHGDGSWHANPLVVAVTFKVVKANIDSVPAAA